MRDPRIPEPVSRQVRLYAFDPSVSGETDMSDIGEITIPIRWEDDLAPGPVGEYIEVVDVDPASGVFYVPVDLNHRRILAQNGLAPSETNPQFHQQMVYAVAMATIENFERALGRVALWSSHRSEDHRSEQFVRRLRIYPHALRDRNAYYSPDKKALLFGYFPVGIKDEYNTPGTLVFTCLSHDIIAHETTHALLDGVHPRFNEPVNPDVLAFHEAFADIVAMFQHFSYPGVIRSQIARTRGDLRAESLLSQMAQQFGRASGRGGALRNALGTPPDVHALERTTEPHERGAILVAAVFGAFLTVYGARTRDLYRIASEGSGILKAGDIHPDLARRLADEAARTAQYVLQMAIRATDYCPPVGITFGDYLRGIVTADYEINPDDTYGFRLAFIESFRRWGIYPPGMRSMSTEALLWPTLAAIEEDGGIALRSGLQSLLSEAQPDDGPEPARPASSRSRARTLRPWTLETDRKQAWDAADHNAWVLWGWLIKGKGRGLCRAFGIVVDEDDAPATVFRSNGRIAVEIHAVRWAQRRTARGSTVTDLVVEITQRRRGYFDPEMQKQKDEGPPLGPDEKYDFIYRAGCTFLLDPSLRSVGRVIRTPGTIVDDGQLERLRRFLCEGGLEPSNAFTPARAALTSREPFALLHRHM